MPSFKSTIAGVVVIAAGAAYWYYTNRDVATDEVGYQTQPLSVGRIESIVNTAGTISPVVTVDVGSEVSGLISQLAADFNSEVESGQVIARIDDRTIRARLRQTEADVAAAQANIEQQEANVTRTRADYELAQTELERMRELFARQLSSEADVDRAEANVEITEAQHAVARAQLSAAHAALLQRQAQLEQAQLDLDRTYIRSPVDGTVIDRQVDVGQTVAASLSAPLLFQIAQDLTKMQIEADVDEADIGQVREALTARFTVDAFPERTFVGTVSQVRKAATVTNNVVTYKVIIDADNPRQQLLPGMTANVNIVLGEKDDVLRVSNSALRFTPPGVERQDEGGFQSNLDDRLERLTAELGLDSTQRRAVESALRGMEEAMAEIRAGSQGSRFAGPGGFGAQRERIRQMRQSTQNQLAGVLSPEQLAAFEQRFAGRGGGARDSGANMRPGQVWVVDNGEPKRIRVLTGLSDDQFTEIVSDELSDGDEVIVRLAR
ncbi:MAG: efflux RND transporter periplasmic adaptor subunit [Gammaproteobacteria bacterium]|jgi:HlyD family secretion protein